MSSRAFIANNNNNEKKTNVVQKKSMENEPEKKAVFGVNPTFLLRGIDPVKVLNDYLEGKFIDKVIDNDKIKAISSSIILAPQHGSTYESETYVYRDKTNTQQLIATTNHAQYSIVKASDGTELAIEGLCMWCRCEIKTPPVGIPVEIKWDRAKNLYIFHVDGKYHTFE